MDLINQLFAFFFRALLLVVGLVFVVGMMALASVFLLLALIWSVLTGQKHPVHVVWQRTRSTRDQVWQASRRARPFGQSSVSEARETQSKPSDITDVQDISRKP